jgi:hypothetical protein
MNGLAGNRRKRHRCAKQLSATFSIGTVDFAHGTLTPLTVIGRTIFSIENLM